MGKLSTHALDTAHGHPANGLGLTLRRQNEDGSWEQLTQTTTNDDGRTDGPLLEGDALTEATYEITFEVGAYFCARGVDCPFLEDVPIRFRVFDPAQGYHVPILCSPWSFSTYRGS